MTIANGEQIIRPTIFDWEEICNKYLGVTLIKGEILIGS